MAITKDTSIIISKFSGKIGEVVVKRYRDKIVLTSIPDMRHRKLSEKQKEYHNLMKGANKYARSFVDYPEENEFACKALKVEPPQLYRALIKEYISKKGDKNRLLQMPDNEKMAQQMEELLEMAHS